jgi:hypothetical protein
MKTINDLGFTEINSTTLQKYKFRLCQMLAEEPLQNVSVDVMLDKIVNAVKFQFTKEVLGQPLETIAHPENWKESTKEAFYNGKWFKRIKEKLKTKYPVKYTTYEVRAYYPKIPIPMRDNPHFLRFERKWDL